MRRGRPPIDPGSAVSTSVNVRLPSGLYDKAYARAARKGVSIPELLRRALARTLRGRSDEEK